MKAVKFPEQNDYLGKPKNMTDEECYALPIHRGTMDLGGNNYPQFTSVWEFETEAEKAEFLRTGKLYVQTLGTTQYPQIITGTSPFAKAEDAIPNKEKSLHNSIVISIRGTLWNAYHQKSDDEINGLDPIEPRRVFETGNIIIYRKDNVYKWDNLNADKEWFFNHTKRSIEIKANQYGTFIGCTSVEYSDQYCIIYYMEFKPA